MKKILALILVFSLALGTFSFAAAAPPDVEGTEFEGPVAKLVALGIISGFPDGTYRPGEPVTRAQFAKIIVTALGVDETAGFAADDTKFEDVAADHWAAGFVNVAVDLGIIAGYPDGTFLPEREVSYAEAIKMIVAALGYTPKANDLGGYPSGFLAVAAEEGITDNVTVKENVAANRGDIAVMVDNALTVPMMVQKTWGENPQFAPDRDQTLMKKLDVEEVEGRVVGIPRIDSALDDDEIKIDGEDGGTFRVIGGEDTERAFGNRVTAFVREDVIIGLVIESVFLTDAVEADGDRLMLIQSDKDYDIAGDAVIYIDGEEAELGDKAYDYAKVVLDDDEKVVFVDACNWDGFIAVEETDDDMVFGYGDELDIEDYTMVKDGETIAAADLEEGDILYYNDGAEFAEVYNAYLEGEIERVFAGSLEIDDEEIDMTTGTKYVDGDDLEDFTAEIAKDMMDQGGEVTVFVDRLGNAVLVIGDTEEGTAGSFYAYVMFAGSAATDRRGDSYWPVDVVSQDGEELSYDLYEDVDGNWVEGGELQVFKYEAIEIKVDGSGEVKEVNVFDDGSRMVIAGKYKADAGYVAGKRLQSSAVVFDVPDYDCDAEDIKVSTLGDLSYKEILDSVIYMDSSDRVIVIIVRMAGSGAEAEEYLAVATGDANAVFGEDTWRLALNIDGDQDNYYTERDKDTEGAQDVEAGDFLIVKIDGGTEEVVGITNLTKDEDDSVITGVVAEGGISVSAATLEIEGDDAGTYRLVDAVLLDADLDVINLRDISEGDTVNLLLVSAGSSYAAFVVVTEQAE